MINLRIKRDESKNPKAKAQFKLDARAALKPAIEIPLGIAQHGIELAKFALIVFDNGFRSARGDSAVAISSATAVVGECLSIIELNLQSCDVDNWYQKIRERKSKIKNEYIGLRVENMKRLNVLERETEELFQFKTKVAKFKKGGFSRQLRNVIALENFVKDFQNTLYLNRGFIWKESLSANSFDLLDPEIILRKVLNYTCAKAEDLGFVEVGDELYEVAGSMDRNLQLVQFRKGLSPDIANFTLAHELGHILLHENVIMHRDRATDFSTKQSRTFTEAQADKFAALFLMPSKWVCQIFTEIFQCSQFTINGTTALQLGVNPNELVDYCQTPRDYRVYWQV